MIPARSRNQHATLKLYELFRDHAAFLSTAFPRPSAERQLAPHGFDLISVAYSLWRAAFLADGTANRAEQIEGATEFLEKLVGDNAIAYVQEKAAREWSYYYYIYSADKTLSTANHRLQEDRRWLKEPPKGNVRRLTWDWLQDALDYHIKEWERNLGILNPKTGIEKSSRRD